MLVGSVAAFRIDIARSAGAGMILVKLERL
jgi:hypothetical protein